MIFAPSSSPGFRTTACPSSKPSTPSPSASTTPAPSAPRIRGFGTDGSPGASTGRAGSARLPAAGRAPRRGRQPGPRRPRRAAGPRGRRPRGSGSPARPRILAPSRWYVGRMLSQAELQRLGEEIGLDVVGAAAAEPYEDTERHIRERRERGLFADMRFTMAQPDVSCHPESLLAGARTVVSAALCYYAPEPEPPAGHGRLPRYTWSDSLRRAAREARPARAEARRPLPRPRRREPARGSGGRGPRGRRLLRQEHTPHHAPARVLGRARHARHRPRDRAEPAARARLRLVPPLRRRLPDRSARRPRRARLDQVPLLLEPGARPDPGGLPRAAGGSGLRLRHLPGRLPVEPRRREAPRRARGSPRAPSRTCRSSSGSRRPTTSSRSATTGSTSRGTTRATCAETRSSPPATRATRDLVGAVEPYAEGDDPLLREHARWALDRLGRNRLATSGASSPQRRG